MPRIFISYRRDDSITAAGRIYDNLIHVYDEESIFLDTEDIPPGVEWDTHLTNNITSCDVVLVIIGDKWLDVADNEGNRRLDLPNDFVRFEVEVALRQEDVKVIPVLIKNATMPSAGDLPESLDQLPRRNAIRVRDGADFRPDMARLVGSIQTKPQRRWLPFAIGIIASLLVIALIMALIFIFTQRDATVDAIGNARIETYHGSELLSSETMRIRVDIILRETFVTNTPQSEIIVIPVNQDIISDENASIAQNPTPASTPGSTNDIPNIPPYVLVKLICPQDRFDGCGDKFRKVELLGINSLQWIIQTSGDVSGNQDLQLEMYPANADGTPLSQSGIWSYTFTITVIGSADSHAVAQNITATAVQNMLDVHSTMFAQQTLATVAPVNTQSNTATALASETVDNRINETATALINEATNQAQVATQAVISLTETSVLVQQSTTDAIDNATQVAVDAQAQSQQDATQTAVAIQMTLNPPAATINPDSTDIMPTQGDSVSSSSVQQTATALAQLFGATPTLSDVTPTAESGTGGGIATPAPDSTIDSGAGGTSTALPDTGLFDDVFGGQLFLIISGIAGLLTLIIASRVIRARNYKSED